MASTHADTHLPDDAPQVFLDNGDLGVGEISILAVDDDPEVLDLTASFLERERREFSVRTSTSATEAIADLDGYGTEIEAIVSDYDMPETTDWTFSKRSERAHRRCRLFCLLGKGAKRYRQ